MKPLQEAEDPRVATIFSYATLEQCKKACEEAFRDTTADAYMRGVKDGRALSNRTSWNAGWLDGSRDMKQKALDAASLFSGATADEIIKAILQLSFAERRVNPQRKEAI